MVKKNELKSKETVGSELKESKILHNLDRVFDIFERISFLIFSIGIFVYFLFLLDVIHTVLPFLIIGSVASGSIMILRAIVKGNVVKFLNDAFFSIVIWISGTIMVLGTYFALPPDLSATMRYGESLIIFDITLGPLIAALGLYALDAACKRKEKGFLRELTLIENIAVLFFFIVFMGFFLPLFYREIIAIYLGFALILAGNFVILIIVYFLREKFLNVTVKLLLIAIALTTGILIFIGDLNAIVTSGKGVILEIFLIIGLIMILAMDFGIILFEGISIEKSEETNFVNSEEERHRKYLQQLRKDRMR